MKFSERMGMVQIKSDIQINSMDVDLRNSLWNVIYAIYFSNYESTYTHSNTVLYPIFENLWFKFFKEPLDTIPKYTQSAIEKIRKVFFKWEYFNVYDFIEFLVYEEKREGYKVTIISSINMVLKKELSGYRFVQYLLVLVTNESEILSIENAIKESDQLGLNGVKIHLSEALAKLSDRKTPDYRNSIKESISAIESICQKITNDPKGELGKTLKKLKEHIEIHSALEQGFIKLYGYTSDSDGIRHAMMDETDLDQEDALYMLISCSSFINYLIAKANKIGIKLN